MDIGNTLRILDPVTDFDSNDGVMAPRLDTLNGKVVGMYQNGKLNAGKLLDLIADILSERYDLKGIVRGNYIGNRVMRPNEWRDIEQCDAIILTNGD